MQYLSNFYLFDVLSYFTLGLLFLSVLFIVYRSHRTRLEDLGITVLIAFFASEFIKFLTDKPRPDFEEVFRSTGTSFPSTHTTFAFAIFFFYIISCQVLSSKQDRGNNSLAKIKLPFLSSKDVAFLLYLFVLAMLTALFRVYAGLHFYSDIIAGIVLGFVISWMLAHYDISFRRIK